MDEPFHEGERAVQERAGVSAMAAKVGRGLRTEIDAAAAEFLARRWVLYTGTRDAAGRPWASQLIGPPGFLSALDPHTLRVDAAPAAGDAVLERLGADPTIALLAMDPTTRRRYRVNGTAEITAGDILMVHVREAFGNCPKYIQQREPIGVDRTPPEQSTARETDALDHGQQAFVAAADTFFIATAHPRVGADVSHRGGRPGFVAVRDAGTIAWPDYAGNMMFQTLGNLAVDARAGLLFVDFDGTRTLQLTGRARVDWDAERTATVAGAQRLIELSIDAVVDLSHGNPVQWRLVEPSPHNP